MAHAYRVYTSGKNDCEIYMQPHLLVRSIKPGDLGGSDGWTLNPKPDWAAHWYSVLKEKERKSQNNQSKSK